MRKLRWALAMREMLEACERCLDYTSGMDQAAFLGDRRTYYATIYNLELAGEAGRDIPISVWQSWPGIPWRAIVGGWNLIIDNGYRVTDDDTVWFIITRDIPEIIPPLRTLLQEAEGQDDIHAT